MSYLKSMLLPDEQLIRVATIHWIIFVPGMTFTLMGGAIGFLSHDVVRAAFGDDFVSSIGRAVAGVGMAFALLGLGLLIGAMVRQSSTELAITNRRLIAKYGFISRSTFELMLSRVTGANFEQSITGRILGYGTILVHGAGGDVSPFNGLADPQGFQRTLIRALQMVHDKKDL